MPSGSVLAGLGRRMSCKLMSALKGRGDDETLSGRAGERRPRARTSTRRRIPWRTGSPSRRRGQVAARGQGQLGSYTGEQGADGRCSGAGGQTSSPAAAAAALTAVLWPVSMPHIMRGRPARAGCSRFDACFALHVCGCCAVSSQVSSSPRLIAWVNAVHA